jgi:cyclic pyranopterin phosphate synthase
MIASIPPEINYLRISITDRCNLRCSYCTYWQEWEKLPPTEILSYEELLRIARIAAKIGIKKIRVTGGEPLVRRGVVGFLHGLHQVPGIEEVCLTTNGVLLQELARPIYDAGLRHLNVSLDTLRRDRYRHITGNDKLAAVMAGIEQAASLGFHPLKINCVALKGINDDEIWNLARLAKHYPYQVRFIELMPTVSWEWWRHHFIPVEEIRRRLESLGPLVPVKPAATSGPARIFRVQGFRGELGFISPMSEHHCRTCNRLRVTARGRLRPCLLEDSQINLKGPLRGGSSEHYLEHLLQSAISLKLQRLEKPVSPGAKPEGLAMVGVGG